MQYTASWVLWQGGGRNGRHLGGTHNPLPNDAGLALRNIGVSCVPPHQRELAVPAAVTKYRLALQPQVNWDALKMWQR